MAEASRKRSDAASDMPVDIAPVLESLKDLPTPPLHPLMAHPVAAATAATVIGLGFASQMAGAMMGSWQNAMQAMLRGQEPELVAEKEDLPVEREEPVVVAPIEPIADVKAAMPEKPVKKAAPAPRAKAPKVDVKPKAPVSRRAKPAAREDLKAIAGIGPKVEEMLRKAGVTRLSDIARWSVDDAKRIDAELGLDGRVLRDDWVGQAKQITGVTP
ncbi:5' DNA nuclease [Rhizobium paknamense]|uniref:NADH-quinone oxidoreductase subunit E n=1 Tax=Rhizobium paknamense TaxID=1206817 RepID=A0ABU0I725_9HYPH|nr:5' DNA nuclease [Rhizobium paknamense]MDQ0454018.1 NADH-quinone oxidoreductase subunit E [Rhizobium paknamense]